jgi:hypothetical protein
MRNAVIRKKALKEQTLIRKYLFAPQRIIVPSVSDIAATDWIASRAPWMALP